MKNLIVFVFLHCIAIGIMGQIKNDTAFNSSRLSLNTPTGDLFGTLTIPNDVKKSPVVVIIPGSGPTDRNGNSPLGVKTNAYKMLAENLALNGISSLRFDKRGIGKSMPAMSSESELRFETYIHDVISWISLLESQNRFSAVFILGHSEGSLIGMIAAGQAKVAGFISLAGVGKPADELLQEQLKTNLTPQLLVESNRILDSLRAGKTVATLNPNLLALYRPSVQPYLISWIKYDPAKEIGKLKIPVLIIHGTSDLQVSVNDANLLSEANPNAELVIIENMNHVLKESDSDLQNNMATYTNPDLPLKEGLMKSIVSFIKSKKFK